MRARVLHLGVTEEALVAEVSDDGRHVIAVTEDGKRIAFTLSRGTAEFQSAAFGPRLRLIE
jgi:hypothetical protein